MFKKLSIFAKFSEEENLKRLNSCLKFTLPPTPYRPLIFVFGRRIYVRDYKTLYVCERLLDAWLTWLFLIHTRYNGRLEKWDVSIHDVALQIFPSPPPPLPHPPITTDK